MFFLVTGASGAGKTSVRAAIEAELAPEVECAEFFVLGYPPTWDIAWRHESTERAVEHALGLQKEGKHFLFAGDPVAPGELLAAPSADLLDGIAICLLDIAPDVQTARLTERGDDPGYLPNHLGFAAWMREHSRDPQHMPEVIRNHGWGAMRWDRWAEWRAGDPRWDVTEIDTSGLTKEQVAALVLEWVRSYL